MGAARNIPERPDALFLPYQARWVQDRSRLKLMEKSRQIGISWATAYASVERSARAGARLDEWVSSRDAQQAKLFIQDCARFATALDAGARDLGEVVLDAKKKHSAFALRFANERTIYSLSSNPDAQAGKRGGRILDEFALHPDPKLLWSIAYPGITWGGSLEVISTHRGSGNYFAQLVKEARERGNPKRLSVHRVTLKDALDEGFLYKLQASLPADDPVQEMDEAAYFDFVRSGCPDEETFRQEYLCEPADDASAWLAYDLITPCETTEIGSYQDGPVWVGMDIARRRNFTVIAVLELVGDVLWVRELVELQGQRFSAQLAELARVMRDYRVIRVAMDQTGMGEKLVEDAQDAHGARVEGVVMNGGNKLNLATALRERFEDRCIRIPASATLRADLHSVRKVVGATGAPRLIAEDHDDRGHADRFWALALACAAAAAHAPIDISAWASSGASASARLSATESTDTGWGTVRRIGHGG